MAALSFENQERSGNVAEAIVAAAIWIVSLTLVAATGAYDYLADDLIFQYGRQKICLMTGRKGQLYFVIVPTGLMVVANVASVIFSCVQLKLADVNGTAVRVFVKFLGNMVAFQSIQYALGFVLYFRWSEALKMVFEALVAYEGAIIASSYLLHRVQTLFCRRSKVRELGNLVPGRDQNFVGKDEKNEVK